MIEMIPRVTPRWEAPHHLQPYLNVLEKAPGAELRICFHAPPQHGKTEATIHALARWLKQYPHLCYAYATYNQARSRRVSRKALNVARRARVELDASNLELWVTPQEGQLLWTSVGGGFTGEPVTGVLIIDDPIKGRAEAESLATREGQKDWWHGTAESRLHPGASVIVMMTRWHEDDLSGYLVREQGFTYVCLKAIAEAERPEGDDREIGEALWEQHHPLIKLIPKREGNPWNFASLYQGEPQPRGAKLFRTPAYYSELPQRGFKIIFGVDLAYSESTRADWSVLVELWVVPPPPKRGVVYEPKDYLFFVVNVRRVQVEAPAFANEVLKPKQDQVSGARFFWYAAGTEAGSASFIREKGVALKVMDPKGRDKFTRSLTTCELWNLGRIQLPADAKAHPWVPSFLKEVTGFTGAPGEEDDQVDGLVSGVDAALLYIDDMGIVGSGGRHA